MTEIITFERDPDQRWYAVVPLWEGERDALEMVAGADVMLGILSKGVKNTRNQKSIKKKLEWIVLNGW